MMDFTLEAYKEILNAIQESNIEVYGVNAWVSRKEGVAACLIRHDVDRKPVNSLEMARLESSKGIKTTYYFRAFPCSFDEKIMKEIASLGHEIGYHYEDLSVAKGEFAKAKDLFHENLERIREIAPVYTVAMHGRPLSSIDNLDFWKKFNRADFDLVAEAFLDIDYNEMYYFTDTGRTFGETSANLRDKVDSLKKNSVESSQELIRFFRSKPESSVALVIHPERWSINSWDWTTQLMKDQCINAVKKVLRVIR